MSGIIKAAESAIEAAVPEVAVARAGWRVAIGIAGLALVAFILWWVFIHPGQLAAQAAQSKVDAKLNGASAAAATEAVGQIVVHDREVTTIHDVTKEGENAVRTAAGAEVHSPDVAAALRAALCGMRAYQSEPGCSAVPQDRGGVGPSLPDPGSFTPGK